MMLPTPESGISLRVNSDKTQDTDHQLFKQLTRHLTIETLGFLAPAMAAAIEPDSIEFIDTQIFTDLISGERRTADLIFKARFNPDRSFGFPDLYVVFHLEHQGRDEAGFGRRMLGYYLRQYNREVEEIEPKERKAVMQLVNEWKRLAKSAASHLASSAAGIWGRWIWP